MTEISGEWKALSYNQYRADIRRQSVSQSVRRPRPKWSICRPLFFYALFAAFLAKSPSSPLRLAPLSRTIFVSFLPNIFGTEERQREKQQF